MEKASVRIFSYLPNPRVWKSLIAGEICGVDVEVTGDSPPNLANWLWDFEARELPEEERTENSPYARISKRGFSGTLYKTDAFLEAHPFGTVPAGFCSGGEVGVFESNSIVRAVVRAAEDDHGLYGSSAEEASRIDSFLDATLVMAREAQVYLLEISKLSPPTYERMKSAYEFYLSGIDRSLAAGGYIATSNLTIADIGFACDLGQFLRERLLEEALGKQGFSMISQDMETEYPHASAHLSALADVPAFSTYMGNYLKKVL